MPRKRWCKCLWGRPCAYKTLLTLNQLRLLQALPPHGSRRWQAHFRNQLHQAEYELRREIALESAGRVS